MLQMEQLSRQNMHACEIITKDNFYICGKYDAGKSYISHIYIDFKLEYNFTHFDIVILPIPEKSESLWISCTQLLFVAINYSLYSHKNMAFW